MKIAIIIQARMASTRLSGKVLKEVLNKSLLEYQLERLQRVSLKDSLIVATTTKDADQPIVDLCKGLGVHCFRGSEEDVLSRYHSAAAYYNVEVVVRVTSDCPLIDPLVVNSTIRYYMDNQAYCDYVTNSLEPTYPRGMDVEVFPFSVLDDINSKAFMQPDREHVTPYIYMHPEQYRVVNIPYGKNEGHHRWTVDTPEDFELIKEIIEELYRSKPDFTLDDILRLFERRPDLYDINAHIKQKRYGE